MTTLAEWMSPPMTTEAIDERIHELTVVAFWLNANTELIKVTIAAMEAQRSMLSTLAGGVMPGMTAFPNPWAPAMEAWMNMITGNKGNK